MTITTIVLFIALAVAAILGGTAANEQSKHDPVTPVEQSADDTE